MSSFIVHIFHKVSKAVIPFVFFRMSFHFFILGKGSTCFSIECITADLEGNPVTSDRTL